VEPKHKGRPSEIGTNSEKQVDNSPLLACNYGGYIRQTNHKASLLTDAGIS